MDQRLPSRVMFNNTCMWEYKGDDCTWPGTNAALYFDAVDNKVTDAADDVCGKRLESCKRRFCTYRVADDSYRTPNNSLPYGAFPALGRTK